MLPSILKSSPHRRHGRGSHSNRTGTSEIKVTETVIPSSAPTLPEPPNDLTL
jgi:hypothetical protein